MVESGHRAEIRPVDFTSRRHPDLPVEAVTRSELLARFDPGHFARPERVSFAALLLVRDGSGRHDVDFETIPLRPGRVVEVRPGQVHRWHMEDGCDTVAVLSRSPLPTSGEWFPGDAAHRDLDATSAVTAWALVDALLVEQERFIPDTASERLMMALLEALTALARRASPNAQGAPRPAAYRAFRAALERDPGASHTVRGHVAGLPYSERTVNRACVRATGRSAKALLTDRIALEAKRLLAHTDDPAATVASRLGFGEPSNFHKFFVRATGVTPASFRRRSRP